MTQVNHANEALQRLLEMFQNDQAPSTIAKTYIRKHQEDKGIPSDKWSFNNMLLMLISGTEDARGFKQWQDAGRYVKKGSKAFYILAPCMKKITDDNGEEKIVLVGFKTTPVFKYEDTEGKEIPKFDYAPSNLPPLYDVAKAWKINVKYSAFSGSEYGYCTTDGKNIVLKSHDAEVFFHELAHAAHSKFATVKGGQHADQETIAEMTAAVLCNLYGYEGYTDHCWQYIKSYNNKDSKTALKKILKVLTDIEKCLELILTTATEIEKAA